MKKIISIAIALIMVFAISIPAMAEDMNDTEFAEIAAVSEESTEAAIAIRVTVEDAGFHCGTFGGNGKVDIVNYTDGYHDFEYVGDNAWKLISEDYACPVCGKTDWVSFSNKSGTPDGKNIQLKHWGNTTPEVVYSSLSIDAKVTVTKINTKIIEKWQGEMTPYQTVTQFVSKEYDSTTLSNAGAPKVVKNSNHFCYAVLSKADLANEQPVALELFNGNKLNVVGTAKAKLVNGQIVVEFDSKLMPSTKYGIVAFDGFMPVVKNGNIHSVNIFKTGTGNTVTPYTLTSFQSADKKGANYDKDWAEVVKSATKDNGNIYLYMHANPIQYDLGTETSEIELKVTKEPVVVFTKILEIPSKPRIKDVDFEVLDADGNVVEELSDMEPGTYTVVFYDPYLEGVEGAEYPVVKEVEVVEGKTKEVKYSESYTVDGKTTTKKIDLPYIENELVIINKTVIVK